MKDFQFCAVNIHQVGGTESPTIEKNTISGTPSGYALIKNKYSGVNFIDTYHRTGLYPVKLPFTLGVEGGGVVVEIENEEEISLNDRVVYFGAYGSYAEYSLVPISELIKVPDSLDLKVAVGSLLQGLTAEFLTSFVYPLKKNEICLVHAASGGVGQLLVQLAKIAGAEVIATVSTAEKAKLAKDNGADHVILYAQEDFEKEVLNITDNKGVNVVFDSVGKSTFFKSLNVLMPFGTMITFGNSSGPVPEVAPLILKNAGSIYLTRPSLFDYKLQSEEYLKSGQRLFNLLTKGQLKLTIGLELPLTKASEAHRALEARETMGKVILKI